MCLLEMWIAFSSESYLILGVLLQADEELCVAATWATAEEPGSYATASTEGYAVNARSCDPRVTLLALSTGLTIISGLGCRSCTDMLMEPTRAARSSREPSR